MREYFPDGTPIASWFYGTAIPALEDMGRLVEHKLTICVYGNRYNGFGTLHNANARFTWYGPDSFRTEGDNWTDSYQLKPAGILSAVEIQCRG